MNILSLMRFGKLPITLTHAATAIHVGARMYIDTGTECWRVMQWRSWWFAYMVVRPIEFF